MPDLVLSVSNAVSTVVTNSLRLVSILLVVVLAVVTKPNILKSIVPVLVMPLFLILTSSLVSSAVCTKTAGNCCWDNSSISKGSLVTLPKVIGLLTADKVVTM